MWDHPLSPLFCKLLVKTLHAGYIKICHLDNGCVELTVDRQANTASDLWQNEIYQGRNDCCVTDRIYFTQATLFFVCTRNPKWWLHFKGRFRNDLFVYHTDYGWALIAVLTLFLNHSNGFWSPTEIGFQYHHTWTTIMNSWHSDQLLWN